MVSKLNMAASFSVSLLQEILTPSRVPYPVALELTGCSLPLEKQYAVLYKEIKASYDIYTVSSIFIYFTLSDFNKQVT